MESIIKINHHHKKQTTDFTETTYIPKNNGAFISDDEDSDNQNKKKVFKAFVDHQIVLKSNNDVKKNIKVPELDNNDVKKDKTAKRRNNLTIENKNKEDDKLPNAVFKENKKERIIKLINKKVKFDNERKQKSKIIKPVAINISFYKNLDNFYTPEEIFLYYKYKPALLSVRIFK